MSALDDRRQVARESSYDLPTLSAAALGSETVGRMLTEAIETATRVRITPEMVEAASAAWREAEGSWTEHPGPRQTARLKAAFEAAGFEVEE